MALFHANFCSQVLGMQSNADVILPDSIRPGQRVAVLYLLHGLSDDHTMWQRRTSIERYAAAYPLCVVMPNAHRSWYTDAVHGGRYFTYFAEELPTLMKAFFPISGRREDTFVAGLSMGGYGAFKLALNCPDRYAAAASMSGALDIVRRADNNDWADLFADVFGSKDLARQPPHNLLALVERFGVSDAARSTCPKLFQACGTEDFLYNDNQTFRACAEAAKLPLTYMEQPGGHEWPYWDARIRDILAWLPIER